MKSYHKAAMMLALAFSAGGLLPNQAEGQPIKQRTKPAPFGQRRFSYSAKKPLPEGFTIQPREGMNKKGGQ